MKKICLIAVLGCFMSCTLVSVSLAGPFSTKVMPYSLKYPMIRAVPYDGNIGDVYGQSFGVRRLLTRTVIPMDLWATLEESLHWTRTWDSYGVLGKGEDVFTNAAAGFRRQHQGR